VNLVDTHAHLEELGDLDEAIRRAEEAGVIAIITMGSDRESNLWALSEGANRQGIQKSTGKSSLSKRTLIEPWR